MKPQFAAATTVSAERSKAELDTLLSRHGATSRGIMADDDAGVAVVFVIDGSKFRLDVPLPKREEPKAVDRPRGWQRWNTNQREAWVTREWEQACRTRWRALLLLVKAKLESVAMGLSTVQREFMADLILPNGKTVHAELAAALRGGPSPLMLTTFGGPS